MNVLIIDCTDGTSELQELSAEEEAALADRAVTGLPIPDLPADPDLIPPDPTRLRSPR